MSYILEALRKSERERQRKQAQIQDMVLTEPSASRAGRRPWVAWLVGAVVALNLVSLGYFWAKNPGSAAPAVAAGQRGVVPKQSPLQGHAGDGAIQEAQAPAARPKTESAVKPPLQAEVRAASAPKAPPPAGAVGQPKSPPVPVAAAGPQGDGAPPAATAATAAAKAPPARAAVDIPAPNPPAAEPPQPMAADEEPAVSDTAETVADTEPPPAEAAAPPLQSMPADFQAKIPPLKISLHAYFRDPRKRFAVINMTRYEVGAEVADGVRLEAIDAKGLILSHGDTRFRVNRP